MAKLSRYTQKLFGSQASTNQLAEFGSFASGSPARYSGTTITPAIIQTLTNYLQGWFAAVSASYSPAIEDMNALCYLFAYQLSYLMQTGVPEWDAGTTYYIGSVVNDGLGNSYVSLTNNNLNNALTSSANWIYRNQGFRTVTLNTTILATDYLIRSNSTAGNLIVTLPLIASTPVGRTFTIKDVGTGGFTTTVTANSIDDIDTLGVSYPTPLSQGNSITLYNNGTNWDVI